MSLLLPSRSPSNKTKVIQMQTFTTGVLCLGLNIYPLLPLATSAKEQLGIAKCTLSVASLLRGRAYSWCSELINQLVGQ